MAAAAAMAANLTPALPDRAPNLSWTIAPVIRGRSEADSSLSLGYEKKPNTRRVVREANESRSFV